MAALILLFCILQISSLGLIYFLALPNTDILVSMTEFFFVKFDFIPPPTTWYFIFLHFEAYIGDKTLH